MCSTKSILKTISLAIAFLSFGFSSSICLGQSDDAASEGESPRKPTFNNPFSKMFSKKEGASEESPPAASKSSKPPSMSKPALSSARPGKPAIAATPTSNRGGLLMPLKSFTNRVFKSNEDTSEQLPQPVEDFQPLQTKPSREPFRNLPRPRFSERREERFTNDINVQPVETSSSIADRPGLSTLEPPASAKPAPIVRNENQFGTTSKSVNQKPTTVAIPPAPIVPFLEMNSTSRRTGDLQSESDIGATTPSTLSAETETTLLDLSTDGRGKKSTFSVSLPPSKPTNRFAEDSPRASNVNSSGNGGANANSAVNSNSAASRRSAPTSPEVALDLPTKSGESNGTPMVSSIRTRSEAKPKAEPAPKSVSTKQEPAVVRNTSIADMSQPGIRIYLNGPDSLLVGQDAVYEIVAKNEGSSDLSGLLFRMSVPASVVLSNIAASEGTAQPDNENGENAVGWELEKLLPGTAKTLRFTLSTQQPEHFAMGVEWTSLPNTNQLQINVQQPKLDLALEGPSEAEFGTPQNYRLRIKNPGNAVVKAVEIVLTAETFGSNQSVIGDIQPGSERIVDVELLFQQPGVIPIVATATSAVSKLQARNSIDVRVKQSAIVAQWNGPTEFYQGSIAEYSLTLTNQGESAALNIPCTVKLPQGADPITLPPGANRRGNIVQWEMKRLLPLESTSIPFSLMLGNIGNNTLSFSAESKNGTALGSEISTNVDSIADLKLTVIDPVAPAPIGQPVFYEIEISNRGRKAANSVEVIAQFSDGIEPIRVDGHAGRIVPGQVIFTPIPAIGPGEKVTLKVAAEAKSAGVHRFRAEVKSASSDTDLIHEESTRYLATGSGQPTRR